VLGVVDDTHALHPLIGNFPGIVESLDFGELLFELLYLDVIVFVLLGFYLTKLPFDVGELLGQLGELGPQGGGFVMTEVGWLGIWR
jgi:hypothetical protein